MAAWPRPAVLPVRRVDRSRALGLLLLCATTTTSTANSPSPVNSQPGGFLVEGAVPAAYDGYARLVFLFDGHDAAAVDTARQQWRAAKTAGCAVAYWQQTEAGRVEKRA